MFLKQRGIVTFHCGIVLIFIMSSCNTAMTYIQSVPNVPMFENEKELQLSGYIGFNHFEVQTAYSLTPKVGLTANMFYGIKNSLSIEAGGGYHYKLQNTRLLEIYGGYGYGEIDKEHTPSRLTTEYFDIDVKFHRFYIQPGYIFQIKKSKLAISLRSSFIKYPMFYFKYIQDNYVNYNNIDVIMTIETDTIIKNNINGFVLDPVVTYRIGGKRVKIVFQLGYSLPLFDIESSIDKTQPLYQKLILNTGILFRLGKNSEEKEL